MGNKDNGIFIVIEGIDGSGKSTQIRLLSERLIKDGRKTYITAEPTATVSGGLLRDALSGAQQRSPSEIAALFLLDRINHNVNKQNGIDKLTHEGYDVICDRYYYSSLAYQGSETDFEWVRDMNLNCPEIRKPDICIFLDLLPDVSLARIGSRAVTEIYEEKDKLTKIRDKYHSVLQSLSKTDNIVIINADRTVEEIAELIYKEVQTVM